MSRIVISSCANSGRVCEFAKQAIGNDVLSIMMDYKTNNSFFDLGLVVAMCKFFGLEPADVMGVGHDK